MGFAGVGGEENLRLGGIKVPENSTFLTRRTRAREIYLYPPPSLGWSRITKKCTPARPPAVADRKHYPVWKAFSVSYSRRTGRRTFFENFAR